MLRKTEWAILILFFGLAVTITGWAMLGDGGTLATAGATIAWGSVFVMFFGLTFMAIFRSGAESGGREYRQGVQDGQKGMIEMGYILADLNRQNAQATRQGLINDGHVAKGMMAIIGQVSKQMLGLVDDAAEIKAKAMAAQQQPGEWWEVSPGVYASDPGEGVPVDQGGAGWDDWDPYGQSYGGRR